MKLKLCTNLPTRKKKLSGKSICCELSNMTRIGNHPMTENAEDQPVLTDAAKAEIAEAIRIVASDKSYADIRAIREHLIPPTPENTPSGDGEPTAPPKKSGKKDGEKEPEEKEPEKKEPVSSGGLWWHPERLAE
jgi:hypothetical protein